MKTDRDIKDRLQAELNQWYIKQCQDNSGDYYLYYIENTREHDSGFLFMQDPPANKDFKLGWSERVGKNLTIEQNFNIFYPILRTLPILSQT